MRELTIKHKTKDQHYKSIVCNVCAIGTSFSLSSLGGEKCNWYIADTRESDAQVCGVCGNHDIPRQQVVTVTFDHGRGRFGCTLADAVREMSDFTDHMSRRFQYVTEEQRSKMWKLDNRWLASPGRIYHDGDVYRHWEPESGLPD